MDFSHTKKKKMHSLALVAIQIYVISLVSHQIITTTHAFQPCHSRIMDRTVSSRSRSSSSCSLIQQTKTSRSTSKNIHQASRSRQNTVPTLTIGNKQHTKQDELFHQTNKEIMDTSTVHKRASNRLLTRDQEEFFDSLDENIYGGPFVEKLRDLQEFKNIYGTCRVPKRYRDNPALGNWVNKTRQMYRKYLQGENTSMTKERVEILNKMGFLWSAANAIVATTITNSSSYHSNNHLHNPHHHDYNDNDDENINYNLNVLSPTHQLWNENYQKLKDILEQSHHHHHHQVTSYNNRSMSMTMDTKLGVWSANQRREYQKWQRGEKSAITKERIDLLNSIGFDWNPWETKWKTRIRQLKEYCKENGHCMVPVNYEKNPKLGRWVATQRKYYNLYKNGKPSSISKERIKELTDIGFVWNRWEDVWMECGSSGLDTSTMQRK